MRSIRLILLSLLPLLCVLLPAVAPTDKVVAAKEAPLSFTLETKEKVVEFLQPIAIRVEVRNNSQSSLPLDTKTLRLHPEDWHVVGTWGQWSGGGEGYPLDAEDRAAGRVELAPGASLRLLTVHEYPSFELLGPTRVGYKLSSTDAATKKLLTTDTRELSLHIPPTKLMTTVWAAASQSEREQSQAAFNEFLKLWARTEAPPKEDDERNFRKRFTDREFATKTLFYLAGYALPFLSDATRDKDPFIREQAVLAYPFAAGAIEQFDAYLDALDALGPRPQWALSLNKGHNKDQTDWRAFAVRALSDPAPSVRIAGVAVLRKKYWSESEQGVITTSIGSPKTNPEPVLDLDKRDEASDKREQALRELDAVKALSKDADAGVRSAVQKYLTSFVDQSAGADTVADAVTDPDPTVRKNALDALLRSPEPSSLQAINRAFAQAKGDTALGLIPLLLEQENSTLSATLGKDFVRRSEAERLAIMTAIAGHNDSDAIELIRSGLNDPAAAVQRAATMRLLALPANSSMPLIDNYLRRAPSELKSLAEAVKTEIQTRRLWPFLKTTSNTQAAASESVFPSQNGMTPLTSPDGQWIAYVETGWGRPGGSGGFGRSNLISITHVVGTNGENDRVVSDMFLVSWMSDSKRVGTARDAFVAISDVDGNVLAEFGELLEMRYRSTYAPGAAWTTTDLRSQFGGSMPHQKRLDGSEDFGFGEGGAFSPDGKWYGPLQDDKGFFLLAADGQRLPIKLPLDDRSTKALWSPDGRYVQLSDDPDWLIVDMQSLRFHKIQNVSDGNGCESKCRWNPWSKDGTRLTFVRDGQVWVSDALGNGAKQLTFDATTKAFPTFSPDGRSVAYRTWQLDNRRHYSRVGRTDLWVVDVGSTLVTRVTKRVNGNIMNFDWLDDHTFICDRLEEAEKSSFFPLPSSSLRRISLLSAAADN